MNITPYLMPGKRCHLVGIGGISMRALGEVLYGMGVSVTGSDMQESEAVIQLRSKGIPVVLGHFGENVHGADCVIRTAAVHDDNPEIAEAHKLGIPVFERAQTWGWLMKSYRNALCISGTHGKTTTTSMATHILMEAGRDPTVMIGGVLPALGSSYRVGKSDTIVLESCEYCNSFLNFFPTVATILNIEADHLDFFTDLDDIIHSFHSFAELLPENGIIVVNADDENAEKAIENVNRRVITFGFSEGAMVRGLNFTDERYNEFDVEYNGQHYTHLKLNLWGKHNALDALAATASAIALDIPGDAVAQGLATFTGAGRRMEFKGEYKGALIYDDYAHHPSELKATLEAAKTMGKERIICAFQPHTFSRTKALFKDFVDALSHADIVLLADIYAARESNTIGITSRDLANAIDCAEYLGTLDKVAQRITELAGPNDLILTIGAGNINQVADMILENN